MSFDAFVSYSHAADGRLAPALQRAIQRLAKPWYRARALRVFRDESALSANPHLWSSIQTAMDESAWFVLLASPDAVASEWVMREIAHWLSSKSVDRLLVVVTDGTWEWDSEAHALSGTAVPAALREAFGDEPRHVDVRWARSEIDLDLRNSRFRDVIAQLAAPLHGVAKDDLEGEDIRQHRRARRLARGGVTALTLLVILSLAFGTIAALERNDARSQRSRAISERDRADEQSRLADARRLAAIATSGARDDLSRSALLAIEADRLVNNAETRGAILSLSEDAAPVREIIHGSWSAAAVSDDGQTVATVGAQGISIIDLETRRSRSLSRRNFQNIRSVSFSPDAKLLAVGGNDVEILDAHTGAPTRSSFRFEDHAGTERTLVAHVHFSPDGSTIAAIDNSGLGYLWLLANGAELAHFKTGSYGGGSSNIAFSPDGRWLTVTDSHAVVYDAHSFHAHQLEPRYGNPAFVGFSEWDVAFSPDGKRFAAATGGGQILFRDSATGVEVGPAIATGSGVEKLAFSPDGSTIAGSRPDGTIAVWDTQVKTDGSQSGALHDDALLGRTRRPLSMSFAPDAALVVLTTAEIVVLDPSARLGREIAPPSLARGFGITALVPAPDGRSIAAPDGLGRVRIFDVESGKLERTITATTTNGFGAQDVAYQPGTHTIVVGAGDGTVTAWDLQTGRRVHSPLRLTPPNTAPGTNFLPGRGVFGVAFDARGRTLAAATGDGRVVVIDPNAWKVRRSIQLVDDAIEWTATLTMSPDGNTVALAAPRVVQISDIDGTHRRHVDVGAFDTTSIALQPDGRLLAVGIEDGRVLLTDPTTARVQSTLVSHHGVVDTLAFDPTGTTLAVGGSDGAVTLWALSDRQPIGPPIRSSQDGGISGLAFSPDGNSLFAAAGDLSVVRYDLRPGEQIHRLCAVVGRNLTPEERRTYLADPAEGRRTCPNWPAGR